MTKIRENFYMYFQRLKIKYKEFKITKKVVAIFFAAWLVKLVIFILFFTLSASAKSNANISSYKQVKCANSSTVYYLDQKAHYKKVYTNEQAFLSYGNKWSDVKTIDCTLIKNWPEVKLAKTKNNNKVYYLSGNKKYPLSFMSELQSLPLNKKDIFVFSDADLNSYATQKSLASIYKLASGGISRENLEVSIQNNPTRFDYLYTGSKNNTVAVIQLKADDKSATVNSLKISRKGFSNDTAVKAIYLQDENNNTLGSPVSINDGQATFYFGGSPLVINPGETKNLYLKLDLKQINVDKQNMKFGFENANDIDASISASGNFPMYAPEYTLLYAENVMGKVVVKNIVLANSSRTLKIGTKQEKIVSLKIEEGTGIEDVSIKKITLTNIGTSHDADLQNFKLINEKGKTLATTKNQVNYKVTFDLGSGYEIKRSLFSSLTVKADVVSGGDTNFKFIINKDSDIEAKGKNSEQYLEIVNFGYYPTGTVCENECNLFKIQRGTVFLASKTVSDSEAKIYRNQNDAIIGQFELRNNYGDIKLESIKASVIVTGTNKLTYPVFLYDSKKNTVLASLTGPEVQNKLGSFEIGNYFIKSNETGKLVFKTRIPEDAQSGDVYKVSIDSITYTTSDEQTQTDKINIDSQTRRLVKPAVYLYSGTFTDKELPVAGASKVKLATFKLESTNEEKVKVTSLTFTNLSGHTNISYTNGFSNLALYKGSSKIGNLIEQPDSNSYTFDNLSLTIAAGDSSEINLKADISLDASGEVGVTLENVTAEGYTTKAPVEVFNTNVNSIAPAITKSSLDIKAISGGSITAGTKNNLVGSFTLGNGSAENVKLSSVTIMSDNCAGGFSKSNGYTYLRFATIVNNKTKNIGSSVSSPVAELNKISLSSYKVAPNETITFNLYTDASKDTNICDVNFKLNYLEAEGDISKIKITVNGYPTDTLTALVTPASNTSNNSGSQNNNNQTAKLSWPTSTHTINYHFNDPNYPFISSLGQHTGVDINASQGSSVKAAAAGTVIAVFDGGDSSSCSYIEIDHGNGIVTLYAHLSQISVKAGEKVYSGEVIGKSGGQPGTNGAGAYSTGAHLHFEVQLNGTQVDPETYLK